MDKTEVETNSEEEESVSFRELPVGEDDEEPKEGSYRPTKVSNLPVRELTAEEEATIEEEVDVDVVLVADEEEEEVAEVTNEEDPELRIEVARVEEEANEVKEDADEEEEDVEVPDEEEVAVVEVEEAEAELVTLTEQLPLTTKLRPLMTLVPFPSFTPTATVLQKRCQSQQKVLCISCNVPQRKNGNSACQLTR